MAQRSRVPQFGNWETEGNVPYTVYFDKAREGRGAGKIVNPNDPQESPELHRDYVAPIRAVYGDSTPSRFGRGVSSGEAPKRSMRTSIGSENSIDKSPLHPQARGTGRGSMASPAWEGKSSYDSSHGTPTRSRLRPSGRGDESPDKGAAVPKFGDWDENNPASADGYTHIFNKVREERNNGGRAPGMPGSQSPHNNGRNRRTSNSSAKCCCFPFWRK